MCKFTPLGLETQALGFDTNFLTLCKFTPLGFETGVAMGYAGAKNLCKFTPLGFETIPATGLRRLGLSVNLPRWGLKPNMTPVTIA